MAAHPNASPVNGYVCLVDGQRFSSKVNLVAHWNVYGHAPASMQHYRIAQARAVITGEIPSIVPVGVDEAAPPVRPSR